MFEESQSRYTCNAVSPYFIGEMVVLRNAQNKPLNVFLNVSLISLSMNIGKGFGRFSMLKRLKKN
jgi:hypothetical protein